jgi:cytochrome c oxidase assembly protein subunit 11
MKKLDRNRATAITAACASIGMLALAYAAVPLYRIFCQVTGYGGTTQVAEVAPGVVGKRTVTVRFDASVHQGMPWDFRPAQREVVVRVGEPTLIHYVATNPTSVPIVGQAAFNVTPDKAGKYFDKVQCFCFTEQRLEPGQTANMPVSFFIDPAILKDHRLDDVDTFTLSYTFFRLDEPVKVSGAVGAGNAN